MNNFALDIGGAKIIYQMTSFTHGLSRWCSMRRWWTGGEASCDHDFVLPREVIRAGDAVEGECWTFEGAVGHIAIRLSERVRISNITIQHLPFPATVFQAPRRMSLWALADPALPVLQRIPGPLITMAAQFHTHQRFPLPKDVKNSIFVLLDEFNYDLSTNSRSFIQTFPIQHADFLEGSRVIIVGVASNWGSPSTCISRIKVHGISMAEY
ncbi:hypothetical protein C8R43DRAFT_893145 [Mycena crocata]|nr:hypothetical protein C8R43DRAFT_893145 [Mycena crocata]